MLLAKANIPPTNLEKDARGRPYLADNPLVDFSISHTATHAFCLLSIGTKTSPPLHVGLDAEPLETARGEAKYRALAARFFAPSERLLLSNAADIKRTFLEIFTKKEAFAKLTGLGLSKSLATLDTANADFQSRHGVTFFVTSLATHIVTVCTHANAAPDIQIFSF